MVWVADSKDVLISADGTADENFGRVFVLLYLDWN